MKVLFDGFVVCSRNNAVALERSEGRVVFGGESMTEGARPRRRHDDRMRWMRLDESLGEVLATQHV